LAQETRHNQDDISLSAKEENSSLQKGKLLNFQRSGWRLREKP